MKILNKILNVRISFFCMVIILLCGFNISNAITITSVQSGNWDNPATWDCACVPSAKDDAVILSGDIVVLTDDIKINNLTIAATAVLDVSISNYKIEIQENWINNGTFIQRSGKVIFSKKQDAIIGGSNTTIFFDLTIDKKSKAGVTLFAPIIVTHVLKLKQGILYTDDTNYITMETGAIMIDASHKSYIDGPIEIETDTIGRIVIGTGKNGKHKKIAIDVNSTDTTAFRVEYFDNMFSDITCEPGVNHVNATEYWQLFKTAGNANISVTLYWDVNSGSDPIHDLTQVTVVRFDSVQWVDEGSEAVTGNPATGSVSSDSLTSSGFFTFGCYHNGMGKKGSNEADDPSDYEIFADSKYESSVTIDENNASFDINVRPNPSQSDKLCIDIIGNESREVLIVVVDLLGREYYSKVCVLETDKYTLAVDPNNKLTPGVYMIVATSRNSLYRKKVVIQ